MVGVDGRGRVDLQAVVALAGILEQAVHGVEDLVGEQEEPFAVRGTGGDGVSGRNRNKKIKQGNEGNFSHCIGQNN